MSDSSKSVRQSTSNGPSNGAAIFCLGLLLLGFYLLTYSGGFESSDSVSMYAVAESVAKRGEFDTGPFIWDRWTAGYQDAQGDFGADGEIYSKKGLGGPIAAAPLTWLALHLPGLGLIHTTYLFNPVVTALTAVILCLYVVRLGYRRDIALLTGGLFGLATIAWPYTRTFYSEPFVGFLLVLAAYFLLAYHQEHKFGYLLGGGLAMGWAAVTRVTNLVVLPIFFAYALGPALWQMRPSVNTDERRDRGMTCRITTALIVLCAAVGAGLLVIALYNFVRFQTPFQSGYARTVGFWTPLGEGLYGFFLSPDKSLFLYAPALLLSVISLPLFVRRHLRESTFLAALFIVPAALFAKWMDWEGGLAWGPRYLVMVLPLLVPFSAPGLAWLLAQPPFGQLSAGWNWLRRGLLLLATVLVLWSVSIQVFAASVNFVHYLRIPRAIAADWQGSPFALSPPLLPFIFSPSVISQDLIELAWFRLIAPGTVIILWAPLIATALFTLAVIVALFWIRSRPLNRRAAVGLGITGILLVTLLAGFSLRRYYDAPGRSAGDDYMALVDYLARHERPNDTLLVSSHMYMGFFMNYSKARMKWYSLLSKENDPTSDEAALLARVTSQHPRIWLAIDRVPTLDLPRPAEKWLIERAYPIDEHTFSDYCRLCLFSTADLPDPNTPQHALALNLGRTIRLIGYDVYANDSPDDEATRDPQEDREGNLAAGQSLRFSLLWEAQRIPDADYVVFTQILDDSARVVWQSDRRPAAGFHPTDTWFPGERIRDNYGLIVPSDWPPGPYRLIAGMYDPQTGTRQLVTDADGQPLGDYVTLAENLF